MEVGPRPATPVTYTNARGTTYFLCSVATKAGKSRLVASRTIVGTPLSDLPEGHEFAENVNGQVSVRRVRPQIITPDELATVRAVIASARGCEPYRAAEERNAIVIHQPSMWPAAFEEMAGEMFDGQPDAITAARMRRFAEVNATYSPLVRFVLSDRDRRTFNVDRRYFSGDGGWLPVEWDKRLEPAARKAVSLLGPRGPKEAFFQWV